MNVDQLLDDIAAWDVPPALRTRMLSALNELQAFKRQENLQNAMEKLADNHAMALLEKCKPGVISTELYKEIERFLGKGK